jgi:threonine synthase
MTAFPQRRCSACGTLVRDPTVFACPRRRDGDDIDHLLEPSDPPGPWPDGTAESGADNNPFVRYRTLSWSWRLAQAAGLDDDHYVQLVVALDAAVAAVEGRPNGFFVTPLRQLPDLGDALGLPPSTTLWGKDETGNVSGSHKARHLMGLMIHLALLELLGLLRGRPPLAIASCGNAAVGAAVVAAAAAWPLRVFVPPDANRAVLERLLGLEAQVRLCPRQPGEVGDPCYLRFREAVAQGAIPFATQGPENGLTTCGGATLGYELADQLAAESAGAIDRLYVQIGGGALASSVMSGLRRAVRMGRLQRLPQLVAVQTTGASPLVRAYNRASDQLSEGPTDVTVPALLHRLAQHRSEVMWPWEDEPHSLATGILDDETYDWRAIVDALLRTNGRALAVGEADIAEAHRLVHCHTQIDADPTGTAGVAGLLAEARAATVAPGENVAVLLTGVTR